MFKQRLLTALVLIPLVLITILWLDAAWFGFLFALVIVLGAWEWGRLCGFSEIFSGLYSLLIALLILLLFFLGDQEIYVWIITCAVFYWIFGLLVIISYQLKKNLLLGSGLLMMSIGLLLFVSTWLALFSLRSLPDKGSDLVIYILFLVWAADSGAYFIGQKWGKRRLASRISPGKTWEGAIGSIISGLFVTMIYVFMVSDILDNQLIFAGLSMITILASIIGDLMESMLKRMSNTKNSGNILPGHGGVMDRIDSLTAACPVFVFGLNLMGIMQ